MAERVLMIEDDAALARLVAEYLRPLGFEVAASGTASDGLRRLEQEAYDAVLLDVMLPDLDGFEVCKRMRAEGVDVPVLFLTALDATEDRLRGLTIGGDDYLVKPFSVEELLARARVILRRVGLTQSELLQYDDLVLDDASHRVTRRDVDVALSPTEYKLLRFLLRNRGRVLSRNQILDHVWDYAFDGDSNVVETFVSSLRRKLDDGGGPLIHTVRGVGYRLGTP
jgi:two-component system OmpR family response regulator